MKAITLTQPWATLVAGGEKRIETRAWPTNYRGPVAIHAALTIPPWVYEVVEKDARFLTAIIRCGYRTIRSLPRGYVLAVADLVDCRPTEGMPLQISPQEYLFGDFSPKRWAFLFENVYRLPEPIEARGQLNIWELYGYEHLLAQKDAANLARP